MRYLQINTPSNEVIISLHSFKITGATAFPDFHKMRPCFRETRFRTTWDFQEGEGEVSTGECKTEEERLRRKNAVIVYQMSSL